MHFQSYLFWLWCLSPSHWSYLTFCLDIWSPQPLLWCYFLVWLVNMYYCLQPLLWSSFRWYSSLYIFVLCATSLNFVVLLYMLFTLFDRRQMSLAKTKSSKKEFMVNLMPVFLFHSVHIHTQVCCRDEYERRYDASLSYSRCHTPDVNRNQSDCWPLCNTQHS